MQSSPPLSFRHAFICSRTLDNPTVWQLVVVINVYNLVETNAKLLTPNLHLRIYLFKPTTKTFARKYLNKWKANLTSYSINCLKYIKTISHKADGNPKTKSKLVKHCTCTSVGYTLEDQTLKALIKFLFQLNLLSKYFIAFFLNNKKKAEFVLVVTTLIS